MGIASLFAPPGSQLKRKRGDVVLVELDEKTDQPLASMKFQHFPETIQDSKQIGWKGREIPGGSLPLYQWTSGGERSISFTAVFATDTDLSATGPLGPATDLPVLVSAGLGRRNLDIRTALLWLARFRYPRYDANVTYAPRKCGLVIKGSGINLNGGDGGTGSMIVCVMQACDISYEAFFPSNMPRIATVNLTFAQVPQYQGSVVFPTVTDAMDMTVMDGIGAGTRQGYAPYPLTEFISPKDDAFGGGTLPD